MATDTEIENAILALLRVRAPEASICPSEVARVLNGGDSQGWRQLMTPVRAVVKRLATAHRVRITRQGEEIRPDVWGKGPVRLHRGARFEE